MKKMKKNIILLLSAFILLAAFPSMVHAKDGTGNVNVAAVQKIKKKDPAIKASNKTYTIGVNNKSLGATAKTKLSYQSSNPKVATVNSKGQVTAKKCGTAEITITAKGTKTYLSKKKVITITVNPKVPTIKSVIATGKKEISVVINKIAGVNGYQIKYSTKSTMSNAKTINVGTSGNKEISNLSGGVRYYVSVRSYCKVSGKKYYSGWSALKSRTAKSQGHTHRWKAQYKSIKHEATGHYEWGVIRSAYDEPVYVWRTLCVKCGKDLTNLSEDEFINHVFEHGAYNNRLVQVDSIHHNAVMGDVWVEDKAAWTEKKLIGYKCSICGKEK